MSGGDSPSCLNPSSIIDSPDWNLGPLEQDTENLIQRASERLRKLTNIFSKVFIVRRIQTWKNIRKAELIHSEIESLLPRLSVKHQNIQKWLSSLKTCKINLIMQGLSLTRDLQNAVNSYQARLEYNDELSNDCLQNNFDISRITHDLLASLNFTVVCTKDFFFAMASNFFRVHRKFSISIITRNIRTTLSNKSHLGMLYYTFHFVSAFLLFRSNT